MNDFKSRKKWLAIYLTAITLSVTFAAGTSPAVYLMFLINDHVSATHSLNKAGVLQVVAAIYFLATVVVLLHLLRHLPEEWPSYTAEARLRAWGLVWSVARINIFLWLVSIAMSLILARAGRLDLCFLAYTVPPLFFGALSVVMSMYFLENALIRHIEREGFRAELASEARADERESSEVVE